MNSRIDTMNESRVKPITENPDNVVFKKKE